jgi:hypothetical protein
MPEYNFHHHEQSETEKKQNKKEWTESSDQTALSPKEKFFSGLMFLVVIGILFLLINSGENNSWW